MKLKSSTRIHRKSRILGQPGIWARTAALLISAAAILPATADDGSVSTDTPIDEIRSIFEFFHTPANVVQLQVASDKTLYAWQNLSAFQYTMQIDRDGPISELPEKIDPTTLNSNRSPLFTG